jgi:hypothetical protein
MYSEKSLLSNHNYAIMNNSSLNNIEISIMQNGKKLILSAVENETNLISPNYGTFSNIRVNTRNPIIIKKLVKKLFSKLSSRYQEFHLTLPPYFYNKNLKLIVTELLSYGAFIEKSEINNHIDCSEKIEFSKGNKKKLNKLLNEKFSFHKGASSELRNAYDIIKENRAIKNYKVSLSFNKINNLIKNFNEKFNIWFVYNSSDKPVASAITIDLIDKVRYVFYWGDKLRKDTNSPIVLMAHSLIQENIKNKISVLDLGTSSVNGKINSGLKNFKNSLGAFDSEKLTIGYKNV